MFPPWSRDYAASEMLGRLNSVYVLLVAVTKSYDLALLDVSTTHIYITGI